MLGLIIAFGLAAAAAEILGGWFITITRKWPQKFQDYLLALSAGFLLALVFTKLIPESIDALGETAPLLFMVGYATLHLFEHTLIPHLHFGKETHEETISKHVAISAIAGLLVHAFLDGVAISITLKFNVVIGVLVFIGIFLHKFPEGLTAGSITLASGKATEALFATVVLGAVTFLGTATGYLLPKLNEKIIGYAFALIAGVGFYVGASDLIPEINNSKTRESPVIVFFGMLLFYITADLLHKAIQIK